ncbi:MAG: aminotransferase class V-fold PLP-dependent enzyme [Theionarchaea archaeon]|nr:aminotransferase class V-fold PLP-dependent enzyme [Theionarchaea archaeon]MBU7020751.1 aminotransferase class V-fold PLP-dependent enzyme [Theionarchaea archaeon]MBU7034886.1 aminotransferase class V-fold PLP-dependent enzyme [Theionarchaea archaeon]MBU7040117.1 aminotransferase class V-fold PLP-dependent enzyme [Theionarchaea archaeon]
MNISRIRERIPALKTCTHLDCAAVSPFFQDTLTEMETFLHKRAEKASFDLDPWLQMLEESRQAVARFVNASSDEIAFMLNTTEGLNTVAHIIPWKKGDSMVTSDLEFPSNSLPWFNLQNKGVVVRQVQNVEGELLLEDIEKAIDDTTRLVSLSFVQFGNGFKCDLKEISKLCKEHNAFLCSDIIQGLGAVPVDVQEMGIDFFATASYKWLMGPLGVGFFFIRKEHLEEMEPPYLGWFSLRDYENFNRPGLNEVELSDTARKFETGGKSFALIGGLKKSLDIFSEIGVETIEKRVLDLSQYVIDNCDAAQTPSDRKKRAGIVNIKHPKPEKVVEALRKQNILVSARMNGIRVSTHFWNTEEDIDDLMHGINAWKK